MSRVMFDRNSPNWIFVFGSNRAGRHGAGAAAAARRQHGAIYGRGVGLQGHSYAIPTKDFPDERGVMRPLPLPHIQVYVDDFVKFAWEHPELNFHVTRIGTGLAGYTDEQIAPMFRNCPSNVELHDIWKAILNGSHKVSTVSTAVGQAQVSSGGKMETCPT